MNCDIHSSETVRNISLDMLQSYQKVSTESADIMHVTLV
jgi:hypothetical protein